MNDLNYMVSTFSKENQQLFTSFLEMRNKRKDNKNIKLFKLLVQNEYDSKSICLKIYGSDKKEAYHALRQRLYNSIIDFTANSSLQGENSINMSVIKYLLAAKSFLQLNNSKAAYKILNKAEKLAIEHHLFPYLNEIYSTQIQFAHSNSEINIDEIITKFKKNKSRLQLEDNLNIVYSKIRQTLNNINFRSEVTDFQTLFDNTLNQHKITLDGNLSFKSLYQLIAIFSLSAFVTKDYFNIESFLINSYNKRLNENNSEKQPYYHIQILYLIANTLFRNKKFTKSVFFLNLMHQQMKEQKKKYFNTFKLKYNLLLALNFNYTNQQNKAINQLSPLIDSKHTDTETLLNIHLSQTMFHFQKNDLKKTSFLLSKLRHSDKWYETKAGIDWVIKKNFMEILLHIELKNINFVDSKLLSFKRNHSKYLIEIKQERVLIYLKLIEDFYKNPEKIGSPKFKSTIENSFEWIHPDQEDIFVMSFYAWLKSKIERKSIYQTTIDLVNLNGNKN